MSSGPTAKIRLVRCPNCQQVLLESPDVPVYECGGCGKRLQAKFRNNNAHGTAPGLQENATAQTSNSDRSPEGMDSSPSDAQTSRQLTGGELSFEDENLLKGQNDRSGQNGSADCCNEPEGGANLPNEDEKQKTYKHRFPDRNDDRLGSSSEVASQNEFEDCNQGPIEDVNLPIEVQTNVKNESEYCEQQQAETENLSNKCQKRASNTTGSSGFGIEQPEMFSEIQDQNEAEGCDSGPLGDVNNASISSGIKSPANEYLEQHLDSNTHCAARESISSYSIISSPNELMRQCLGSISSTTKSYHAYYDDALSSYEGADDQVPNHRKHPFRNAYKPSTDAVQEKRKAKLPVNKSFEMQHHLRSYEAVMSNEAQYGKKSINLEQHEFIDQKTLYAMKSSNLDRDELLEPTRLAPNWGRSESHGGLHSRMPFYGSGKSSNHLNNQFPWSSSFQPQDKAAYEDDEKMKLLRMIDELQDQLHKSYLPHENANGRIPPWITGSKRPPLYYDQEVAERGSLQDLSYQRHPERFREGSKRFQQSKYSNRIPFSAEATYRHSRHRDDHYLCCCPRDSYSSKQLPPRGFQHNEGFCKVHPHLNSYNSYGSRPASPKRYVESDYSSDSIRPKSGDQWQRDYAREKHQLARRHFRPIAGGAPFLTCPSCLKLVKLPEEFLVLRRRCHKLKCGACSEILKFSLINRSHLVPYMPSANEYQERRKNLTGMYESPSEKPSSRMSTSKKANLDIEEVQRRRGRGGGGGSALHRLMGYASPSHMIKGARPFEPENGVK